VISASPPFDGLHARVPVEWGEWPSPGSPFARPGPIVTLGLIGGQRLLRDTTARLLAAQDGLDVLGAFESVSHFLTFNMEKSPAVLLLDCDGDHPAGCRGALARLRGHVKSRIVIICRKVDEEMVRCAMEHQVSGVVLKSFSTEDIKASIEYMAEGRTVMPAGWQRAIAPHQHGRIGLSPRHREILALIAQGHRNEEIAKELELSPNTVKFHIRALYSRLGVRNRVEAANQHALIASGED
jgi:DNA-binding NarL/FixJ family response regulator